LTKHLLIGLLTNLESRRVGQELGSHVDAAIIEELKPRVDTLNIPRPRVLMSYFLEAIKLHIQKKMGLAFGNGNLAAS
jgi:hypothetical protein